MSASRSFVPAIATFIGVLLAFAVVSVLLSRSEERERNRLFESEAAAAFADIERQIGSHITVVEDLASFAEATWPGDIDEWRRYLDGRVTSGNGLAFTSTAGFVEVVPASEIDAVVARERQIEPDFSINEPVPLGPTQDRYVLMRTGLGDGSDVRGIEMSAALLLTDITLPGAGERLLLKGVDEAPAAVLSVLGIDPERLVDDEIYGTNVVFIKAVEAASGDKLLGWVVVPADLSLLLDGVVDRFEGDLSVRIRVPDAPIEGDLGRYEGAGSLALEDADFQSVDEVTVGGWSWSIDLWSNGSSEGVGRAWLTFGFGFVFAVLMAAFVENRRRHGQRLVDTRIELTLQRQLAETDHLTGLRNRQGLAALRQHWEDSQTNRGRGAILFIDLDGFKAINDEQGHAVGDDVLVAVARAIRSVARSNDLLVRTGGDEFVMVCPGMVDSTVAEERIRDIRRALGSGDAPIPVEASVGWSIADHTLAGEFDELIASADAAMYRDKQSRRSGRDHQSSDR